MKITQLTDPEWDLEIQKSAYSSYYQKSFWKNSICQYIGGQARLFKCQIDSKSWLIPCYAGAPWSKCFRIGSVGYGGPIPLHDISHPKQELESFFDILRELNKTYNLPCTGVTTFPWKHWQELSFTSGQQISFTQMIHLANDVKTTFEKVISGNVRTAIRRSQQSNIEVRLIEDAMGIAKAYQLLADTQKRVNAAYITPFPFFEHLCQSTHQGISLWGVFHEDNLISMSLLLIFNHTAIHFFHGWERELILPGANQALIWAMVEKSISLGCDSFNLGESHSDSLRLAKEKWGAINVPILRLSL